MVEEEPAGGSTYADPLGYPGARCPIFLLSPMTDAVQIKAAELGIPDWRDNPTRYPRSGELSLSDWHWEFLRRNHQYREDYDKPESSFDPYSKGYYFQHTYSMSERVDYRQSVQEYIKNASLGLWNVTHFANFLGTWSNASVFAEKRNIGTILSYSSNEGGLSR